MPDAARARGGFETDGWYRSAPVRLLDFDVVVQSDDPELVDLIDELYASLRGTGEGRHTLSLGRMVHLGSPAFFVALGGAVVVRTAARSVAFAHLVFEANQQAIERTSGMMRLHAAGAVSGGRAIVLPGPMGTGKTTLVAGLLRRGLPYLTDEVVALDVVSGLVVPYPKPLSLGSPPAALGPVAWSCAPAARPYLGMTGLAPVSALGAAPAATPVPLGLLVLPRYEPMAPTKVTRLSSVEALASVAAHAFHLDAPGSLPALARVIRDVPCYRLVSGSLDEAVDSVLELSSRRIGAA